VKIWCQKKESNIFWKQKVSNTLAKLAKTRCHQIKLFKNHESRCKLPWKFYKTFIFWQNAIEITSLSHLSPFDNLYKLHCVITRPSKALIYCKTDNVYYHYSFIITLPTSKFGFLHFYSLIGTDIEGSATCDQLDMMQTEMGHNGRRALQWGWGWIRAHYGTSPMAVYIIFTSWLHCLYYPHQHSNKIETSSQIHSMNISYCGDTIKWPLLMIIFL